MVVGVEKLKRTPVAGLSFSPAVREHDVEVDQVGVNMDTVGGDRAVSGNVDEGCPRRSRVGQKTLAQLCLSQKGSEILHPDIALRHAIDKPCNSGSSPTFIPRHLGSSFARLL